jgi:hypothetical protein
VSPGRKDRKAQDREVERRAEAAELALAKAEKARLLAAQKQAAQEEKLRKLAEQGRPPD